MKTILYHGIDYDFFEKLTEASKNFSQCQAFQQAPDKGSLIEGAFRLRPHIIVVDAAFTSYLSEEIRQLKRLSDFRSTLFVGFCKDDLEVKEGEQLLVSGVHLFHMKDADFETFFRDCFYIAFEEKNTNPEFARAKNLEIPLDLGFLSVLSSLSADSFTLETDLKLSEDVELHLPMTAGNSAVTAKINEKIDGGLSAPFFQSYRINFPFPGPWDELSENSLTRETVETWIDLRQKYFDKRKETIVVFTRDDVFTKKLLMDDGASWYQVYRSAPEAKGILFHLKPGLIFFDLQGEEGADLNSLGEVISLLRELEAPPMVIVPGARSDSGALRKLFDYEYLISYSGLLDHIMFLAMEKRFLERARNQSDQFFLKVTDCDRTIEVRKKVLLTSITERDMTFILDSEIPYFSVLKAELPLPLYLTVIPAEGLLPPSKKGTHYRALIHGISEENLTKIRKIVNQLIYTPVTTMSGEVVELMLKQDYVQKAKLPEKPLPVMITTGKTEDSPDRFKLKRNLRGSSKL